MKMNKMFAGLIAFVAGVALSAGSAFATAGYVTGDPAMMKLVPYYETGENRATLIAIQNMSPHEADTQLKNKAVQDAMTALDTEKAKAAPDPTTVANLEKALATAQEAAYTEHIFVTVSVYDSMGMMMDDASATLCLGENQFGYVVLQESEMQDWQMEIANQGEILSMAEGDIPGYGYVEVAAGHTKYTACTAASPAGITTVDTRPLNTTGDALEGDDKTTTSTQSMVAVWAIIQDTGMGFFGTEVPTATITKRGLAAFEAPDATAVPAMDPVLACYSGGDDPSTASTPGTIGNRTGDFMMTRCGLIPERHDNTRIATGVETDMTVDGGPSHRVVATADDRNTVNSATPLAHGFVRYDSGDDTTVYVWLAEGMDTERTLPKDERMLEVTVMCMDGSMPAGPDRNGDNQPDPIKVAAPDMVTRINPADMDGLGMYTDMCDDTRGVLKIKMPDKSTAGMMFSHISQMGNHYRMNFPGYSRANPMTCYEIGGATGAAASKAACD